MTGVPAPPERQHHPAAGEPNRGRGWWPESIPAAGLMIVMRQPIANVPAANRPTEPRAPAVPAGATVAPQLCSATGRCARARGHEIETLFDLTSPCFNVFPCQRRSAKLRHARQRSGNAATSAALQSAQVSISGRYSQRQSGRSGTGRSSSRRLHKPRASTDRDRRSGSAINPNSTAALGPPL